MGLFFGISSISIRSSISMVYFCILITLWKQLVILREEDNDNHGTYFSPFLSKTVCIRYYFCLVLGTFLIFRSYEKLCIQIIFCFVLGAFLVFRTYICLRDNRIINLFTTLLSWGLFVMPNLSDITKIVTLSFLPKKQNLQALPEIKLLTRSVLIVVVSLYLVKC